MRRGDEYRVKAADLMARGRAESDAALRGSFEQLALSYLRLAEQADRNSETDVVYEPPPDRGAGHQVQQQQQPQPKTDDE
jgi:hypothetical protein